MVSFKYYFETNIETGIFVKGSVIFGLSIFKLLVGDFAYVL